MSARETQFVIQPNGNVVAVYSDSLVGFNDEGAVTIRRASHVEPLADGFGWGADLSPVNGPQLGPYATRQAALDAELDWLAAHLPEISAPE
jgi:hypothetical protein